ncbi:hypothetical protein D3C71_1368620 [compost metagenome]
MCRQQLTAQIFHQIAVRLAGARFADQFQQLWRRFDHRQLRNQDLNIFQKQVGGFPAAQEQDVAGDFSGDVRVTVAVAAHPGGETDRDKIYWQAITQVLFELFI